MSLDEKFEVLKHTKVWNVLPEGLLKELAEVMSECMVSPMSYFADLC
jgi:hypothetical protein